ncbi:maleylpyruvate isomerase N-terminal domain-containing protein [Amycolatopsis sp. OK19-0408]|uniref:Maleylpyruvate isomerase N-terminal domain-containing protein n=1 Tax=Amycolatopsis iheyensis TaxID=2945988 RepID=A0A9X2SLD5_9PSEU|nr:maleylpyruvate isomerase N-terminal domain-containing protein [Amycolatopsis iheyensis]MCR6484435.1 maleylpyruvate isomerase N-terminal domain-containing protein [Amycolatopsis iheyensis]
MTIALAQWQAVRAAFAEAGERFATVVENAPDPHAKAIGKWSIVETAAHVGWIALVYTALIKDDGGPLPLPELTEPIATSTIETVEATNEIAQRVYPERDPHRLAERLRADVAEVLAVSRDYDAGRLATWLGGSRVPVPGMLAHLLNEMLIHGRDIARVTGRPWSIDPAHSAMFMELFFVGIVRNDLGRLLDDAVPSPRRITAEFRSPHLKPVMLVLHERTLSATEPDGRADIRLTFDPAVLVLMMFGRVGKARAVLSGGVRLGGRRPWLLPAFLRTVKMP